MFRTASLRGVCGQEIGRPPIAVPTEEARGRISLSYERYRAGEEGTGRCWTMRLSRARI